MAFKEWEERMIKMNEEYKDLYKLDEQDYNLDMRVCANKKCMCNDYYFRKYNYYRFDINIYKCTYGRRCILCKLYTQISMFTEKVGELSKNY